MCTLLFLVIVRGFDFFPLTSSRILYIRNVRFPINDLSLFFAGAYSTCSAVDGRRMMELIQKLSHELDEAKKKQFVRAVPQLMYTHTQH